jgi:peptidoglycan hydrolase-like protein with peptidoglycan-binding domain
MLTVLHWLNPQIPAPPHTGVLDPRTAESVAAFQTAAGLPPTGEIDKRTWKDLALFYALTADQLENAQDL